MFPSAYGPLALAGRNLEAMQRKQGLTDQGMPAPDLGDGGGLGGARRRPGWQNTVGQIGAMLLASGGNPLGGFLLRQAQARQDAEAEAAQYDRRLQDSRNEWLYRQQWERDHPAPQNPLEIERVLDAANITDPTQRQALLRQYAENRANPIQGVPITNDDGSQGLMFVRPGQMGGGQGGGLQPGVVVNGMRFRGGDRRDRNNWEPVGQGGPSQPATGGFPW